MKGGALACLLVALLFVAPTGMQVSERGERSEDTIVHEAMPAEQAINERRAAAALDGLDGFFTENRGQVDNPEVLFYTQGDALSVGLTRTGAMLTLMAEEDGPAKERSQFTKYASRMPVTIAIWLSETSRPRIARGEISAM